MFTKNILISFYIKGELRRKNKYNTILFGLIKYKMQNEEIGSLRIKIVDICHYFIKISLIDLDHDRIQIQFCENLAFINME